ncbi:MAG TPA: S8/S53 family peptidase [Trebonia sp.]
MTDTLDRNYPVSTGDARQGRYVLQPVSDGVTLIRLQGLPPVPEVLDVLDAELGEGAATIDSFLYPCPYPCPATEPMEVPPGTTTPYPPPAGEVLPGQCDGEGVSVSIVDTGLLPGTATTAHSWLAGVTGTLEDPYYPGTRQILPYAGHGTFVAGCLRCMAPKAEVLVVQGFDSGTGKFESDLEPVLEAALDPAPDIFVFTFVSATRKDLSLKTFDDLYDRRIRHILGLVVIVPAGNDGTSRQMWPAAYPWTVSVGALSASWRHRAHFSNYGAWVDVYTPGEDLINAFAVGDYVCTEPPIGAQRFFDGMAMWSGTSFSTPVFAGLVAARMSGSGEDGRQAAAALLQLARSQEVPGIGPVLYPGQGCLHPEEDRQPAAT